MQRGIGAAFSLMLLSAIAIAQTPPSTRPLLRETPLGTLADAARYAVSPDANHVAILRKTAGRWQVVRDGVAGKDYEWIVSASLTFTSDSRHLAYIVQQSGKMFAVVDEKEGKPYHEIVRGELLLSRTGSRIAFIARASSDGKRFLVVDGQEGTPADQIGSLSFSADGKRCVYAAEADGKQYLVIDGRPTPPYDKVIAPYFTFSADGSRHAYAVVHDADKKVGIIVDGQRQTTGDDAGRPVFSPDGQRVAHALRQGNAWSLVLDGKEIRRFDRSLATTTPTTRPMPAELILGESIRFSPDGKRLAYAIGRREFVKADDGKQQLVERFSYILDGQELRAYDSLGPFFFSPDSKRAAYVAVKNRRIVVVLDGSEGKYYEDVRQVQFSPDSSKLVYLAGREGMAYFVTDNSESPAYSDLGSVIVFSSDGKRMAYTASRGRTAFVVVDGKEGKAFSAVAWDLLMFSPDSQHVAYAARRDDTPLIIVDDREIGAAPLVGARLAFQVPNTLRAITVRDKQVNRLEIEIDPK